MNITLLDINDNHPTWKDAPYYINLVEMTPPDSDVTTVSGGGTAECQAALLRASAMPAHEGPTGFLLPSEPAHGADFRKLSCMVEGSQRLWESPRTVLRGSGLLRALSKGAQAAEGQDPGS